MKSNLIKKVEPLRYRELIAPRAQFGKLLSVPIDPRIFSNPDFFTREFLMRVKRRVPKSIREDLKVIQKALGKELEIIANGSIIVSPEAMLPYNFVRQEGVDGKIIIQIGEDKTSLNRLSPQTGVSMYAEMSEEKRETYSRSMSCKPSGAINSLRVLAFYRKATGEELSPTNLYLRNFEIMFNNLAVEELNGCSSGAKRKRL